MQWVNVIVQGILVGGLYALFAAGLSLIFGVMRLVNIAHGDLIVLAAFIALTVMQGTGLGAIASLMLVVPLMAAFGYGLQRSLLNFTIGKDILPPLLVTFAVSVIIQNGLLLTFTADSRRLNAGPIDGSKLARTARNTPAIATTASDSAIARPKMWRLLSPIMRAISASSEVARKARPRAVL